MNQENPHKSTENQPDIYVLIAAAGSGTRFSDNQNEPPKQYKKLLQQSIIRHSIKTFLSIKRVKVIHCIINPEHADWYHETTKLLNLPNPITGGKERNNSIYNALKSLTNAKNEDIVLVHDAARPLISRKEIEDLIEALQHHKAATLASPISGTLRKAENGTCDTVIDRNNLWELQTPQGFQYTDLLKAHETADPNKPYTDDTSMVSELGIPVHIVPGRKTNFKITTKDDLTMAEKIMLAECTDIRTGSGFDVHAFDTQSTGPIRLCGIDIDHTYKLKGHSDADVGLHTITDALLGALGEGDIGIHFPPSDDTFKNMDSAVFLQKAIEMLEAREGFINNIDLTLICEAPKIGPHASTMKTRIAEITRTDESRINVKATTTEKLGFTGRKEGIAAQCTVTIRLKS